jgi:hypothetical protein
MMNNQVEVVEPEEIRDTTEVNSPTTTPANTAFDTHPGVLPIGHSRVDSEKEDGSIYAYRPISEPVEIQSTIPVKACASAPDVDFLDNEPIESISEPMQNDEDMCDSASVTKRDVNTVENDLYVEDDDDDDIVMLPTVPRKEDAVTPLLTKEAAMAISTSKVASRKRLISQKSTVPMPVEKSQRIGKSSIVNSMKSKSQLTIVNHDK